MQPDPTQSPAPAADQPAPVTPESTAPAVPDASPNSHNFDSIFAAALSGLPADDARETTDAASKAGDPPAPTATTDDKPADPGVTSSEPPGEGKDATPTVETSEKPLSRREQVGAEKDARISELEQQVAADRTALRAEILAEIERSAEEARQATLTADERAAYDRFQRLNLLPDDHAELNTPSGVRDTDGVEFSNFEWLQEYKRRLNVDPTARDHADRHYRSEYEQRLAEGQKGLEDIHVGMIQEVSGVADTYGIDRKSWEKPGTTWTQMASDVGKAEYARGCADTEKSLLARVEKAEADAAGARKDAEDARLGSLGGARVPANAGRSSSVAPERQTADPNGSFEDHLARAFGWPNA